MGGGGGVGMPPYAPLPLSFATDTNYGDFKKVYIDILDLHVPMKNKFVKENNAPFLNKTKGFMHRSKLKIYI